MSQVTVRWVIVSFANHSAWHRSKQRLSVQDLIIYQPTANIKTVRVRTTIIIFLTELAIVTSGATKVMSTVSKSEQKPKNLWSESILPDLSLTSNARSVLGPGRESGPDLENKCDYKCLSDSLLQTLDSLSLSNDAFVQGR